MTWFDDRTVVRQFPVAFRWLAHYCRIAVNRSTGVVRGGSFLHRLLARGIRTLHLDDAVPIRVRNATVYLDLLDPRMWWVLDEVRGDSHEHRVIRACLSPGDTFIDVGANHGGYSLFSTQLVGPGGLVVAIEPQPRLAGLIERSLEATAGSPFQVHALACGDRRDTAEFYVPRAGSGSASLFAGYIPGRYTRTRVHIAPLDDLLEWRRFPGQILLKLDAEGSELASLNGARQLVRERRPIVMFEVNPTSSAAAGYAIRDLLEALRNLGYDRAAEIDRFPEAIPLASVQDHRQRNLVALPDARPATRTA